MNNVKWVGASGGYARSSGQRPRTGCYTVRMPRERARPMGAEYWLGVIGVFLLCFAVLVWAAMIGG